MNISNPPRKLSIGVGIDTARYGHRVTFLNQDLQPAAKPMTVTESRDGYDQLFAVMDQLRKKHGDVCFDIRLDAAGQYATNLQAFLQTLPFDTCISIGDPIRNRNYRVAHFPKQKTDDAESHCAARFALLEQPRASIQVSEELRALRDVAGRLESQTQEVTQHVNQLHNLLARVFPELATIVRDISCDFVLTLLKKYPTPERIRRAQPESIHAIPFMREKKAQMIVDAAQRTIGSLSGEVAETLVRASVDQILVAQKLRKKFEELLAATYEKLPFDNQLTSIKGIGTATAAVLTAKILTIDRFDRPEQLVSYFGIFPEQNSSGVDRQGHPKPNAKTRMSKKGNKLVRRYLYNAAMSAAQHNPAIRPLYRRLRAKGLSGNAALGHVMRKLLHLVFAIWKSGKPFNPKHYPWDQSLEQKRDENTRSVEKSADQNGSASTKRAAGHKQGSSPEQKVVTATQSPTVNPEPIRSNAAASLFLRSSLRESASEAPPERTEDETGSNLKSASKKRVITHDAT